MHVLKYQQLIFSLMTEIMYFTFAYFKRVKSKYNRGDFVTCKSGKQQFRNNIYSIQDSFPKQEKFVCQWKILKVQYRQKNRTESQEKATSQIKLTLLGLFVCQHLYAI